MATYKRLAEHAGSSEKIATLLVSNMGYRTREDLETWSGAQVDDKIIPGITDLDIPLVTSSRLKRLIIAIREAAKVSADRKQKGTVRGEDVPLPSEELRRLESLLFSKYRLRFSENEDAGGTMVSRLKRQFNRHCIRTESILKTGLEEEAAFQSGIQMASASWLPFDEVAFTEDMMFSAAWSVQDRTPLKGQRRTFTQILQEMYKRSQPLLEQLKMSAVSHQHYPVDISVALVINIMYSIVRQDNMLPTRLLQGHNWVSTIEATGVLEKFQEKKPLMTRGELLSSNHRQNLIEDFGRPRWTARRFSVPELPGKASEGVVHADATEAGRRCDVPRWLVPTPAFGKQASGN